MSDVPRSSDVSKCSYRPPRTIVLCFDGTNSQYDAKNTNVVKFFGLLRKDRPEEQVAYYQAGIGTYFAPGVVSPCWTWLASLLDEAFAWYLDAHVMGGYKYLMDVYHPGDRVCLFGFSRGAYTARALAGMLEKVGLLQKDNIQQVGFAYKAYTRTDQEGVELAAGFKRTFSRDVKVEFVGVWDTVQSTGMLVSRMLPFTESNTAIKVFRHALSLDEHRARYRPNLYHRPTPDDDPSGEQVTMGKFHAAKSAFKRLFKRKNQKVQPQRTGSADRVPSDRTQPNAEHVTEEPDRTDVLEVWFSGCHSDIGGGSVRDDVKVSLAQITLHWMVEHVMQSQCGILFDNVELARIGFTTPSVSPQPPIDGGQELPDTDTSKVAEVETRGVIGDVHAQGSQNGPNQPTPPQAYPEQADALAPLFDQLKINKLWWILEIMPCSNAWQDANGVWHDQWTINLGRGRYIPFKKPKFHHTVKERINCAKLKYKPRAIHDHEEVYV